MDITGIQVLAVNIPALHTVFRNVNNVNNNVSVLQCHVDQG